MRRATGPGLALAAAMLSLAAALPGAAGAAGPEPSVGIRLERGPYHVNIGNIGQTVVLSVETGAVKSQRHVAATTYLAHGAVGEGRLEASFGDLGQISMRFRPSRHRTWVKPHRNCRGLGASLVRRGVWRGRLRFPGEDGYLGLDLHRVKGTVETVAPQCRHPARRHRSRRQSKSPRHPHRGSRHPGRVRRAAIAEGKLVEPTQEPELGPEVPVVQARWREGVAGAEFVAGAGKEGSVFYAATGEARGRIGVFHSARVEARSKAVRANNALTHAEVAPPRPFHRTASYRAAPDGARTWSGRLFVTFPGAPHYPLTGEPFKSSLELFPELLVGLIGLLSDR